MFGKTHFKMSVNIVFLLSALIFQSVSAYDTILLDKDNTIVLRGEITESSIDNFLMNIISHPNSSKVNVFIHSPGGSVIAGQRVIQYMMSNNVTCITDKAYSMAFAIFQKCHKRYITHSASMMQHQQSLGFEGDLYAINNYMNMINKIEQDMNTMQAKRIGIDIQSFKNKITTEWWLYGDDILQNNVADAIKNIQCTPELASTNVTGYETSMFGTIKKTYSACPLIVKPFYSKDSNF